MNRRNAGLALLLGPVAFGIASRAAEAQQPGKVCRIGYLSAPTRASVEPGVQAFLRALRELGWVEGQTSSSNIAGPTARSSGFPPSRLSWFGSRWI